MCITGAPSALARATTRLFTPNALTSSASSSGGLKSTTPATLTTASMLPCELGTSASSSPRSGSTTSPATGVIFVAQERLEGGARVLLAQRIEHRRGRDLRPEALLRASDPSFGRTSR